MRSTARNVVLSLAAAAVAVTAVVVPAPRLAAQEATPAKKTLSFPAEYTRRVQTDEAVLVLSYRVANLSVGEEWMLLEIAMTVLPDHNMTLERDAFTLTTPDGTELALASQEEFNAASGTLRALDARANIQRESLNYLPKRASIPCRIGFFSDVSKPARGLTQGSVSLNPDSNCVGRLYFKIPGGIQYGRYFLNVALPDGKKIDSPMLIMTKAELKDAKSKVKSWEKQQKKLRKEEAKAAKDAGGNG